MGCRRRLVVQDFRALTLNEIIVIVVHWILAILAIMAILMIIIGGLMYLTSAGNEDRIASAKKMIIYAIVGLVIALLAYIIVNLVNTLLFGSS